MDRELTINATAFKATCLELLDRLSDGRLDKVAVTKRGRVVAVVGPPALAAREKAAYGFMAGTVNLPPDLDLTAPIGDEPWDAAQGILHR